MARANELLAAIRVPPDDFEDLVPVVFGQKKLGSSVNLRFKNAERLDFVRTNLRATRHERVESARKCVAWCDVKKTEEERRPGRVLARALECLSYHEAKQPDAGMV